MEVVTLISKDLPTKLILFGANDLFLVLPAAALIYFLRDSRQAQKELLLLGILLFPLAFVIARLFALFYFDPRPFTNGHFAPLIPHEPDNGFPSDHTLLSAAIAMLVTLRNRPLGMALCCSRRWSVHLVWPPGSIRRST